MHSAFAGSEMIYGEANSGEHPTKKVSEHIPGYSYGTPEVATSPVPMRELDDLKISAGFAVEDQRYLRLAGEVLRDQTRQLVEHWRNRIIAGIPNLARHARTPEVGRIGDAGKGLARLMVDLSGRQQ